MGYFKYDILIADEQQRLSAILIYGRKIMKSMRKFLALLLAMIFAVSLTACSKSTDTKSETTTDPQSTETSGTGGAEDSVIDFDEEPYEVAIENVTLGAEYPDTAAVEEAINAITVPAINCKVKIVNYHIADHATKVSLAVAGGDKLDLINTGLTTSLSTLVSDGIVIAMDELLNERGKDLLAKEGNLVKATTVNGEIFAVPASLYPSKSNGIGYNQSIADEYGITVPENVTLDQLTEIGAKLKAANSGIYLTTQADGALTSLDVFYNLEAFGGDLSYGAVFDPLNGTTVVNAYASEQYKQYCEVLKSWKDLGYIPADSLTNGQNGADVFNAGQTFYQWISVSPNSEQTVAGKGLSFKETLVATTPNTLSTASVQEFGWGITSSCERPEKAMDFLNFLYVNAEVANLLQNGIEGKHYSKVSDNVIKYADGVNPSSPGYGRLFTQFGDTVQQFQFEPATESFHEDLKAFAAEAQESKTLGYVFNTENVATEIAAVSSVVSEYRPVLETGMADDVTAALAEFNAALKDAGIDTIIQENQSQIDAWLAQ
jgi:putative aldouronate transport system substrate-binding protein